MVCAQRSLPWHRPADLPCVRSIALSQLPPPPEGSICPGDGQEGRRGFVECQKPWKSLIVRLRCNASCNLGFGDKSEPESPINLSILSFT